MSERQDRGYGFGPVFLRAWRKVSVRRDAQNGRFGAKLGQIGD